MSTSLFGAITITPASRTFNKDGGGGAILTAGSGTWTASTAANWITITPNTSGNVGDSVVYIVNSNFSADTRVGTIQVSGNTHTVTQTGYDASISPVTASLDLNGGVGTIDVTTLAGVSWTAKSNVDWITLDSSVGLANGTVSYSVAKNVDVVARTGTITVAGNTFSVTQTGVDVTLSPTSVRLEPTAQVVLLTITALNATSWTVKPNSSWISVVSGGNGFGGGSATLAVAANPSWVERTGTVSVGTATLTIKQKGTKDLSFSITPETATAVSEGAYGNVAVIATPDAPWTAESESSWITLSNGKTGAGNGNIQYVVSPNTTLSERTGTIKITPPVAEPDIDLYSGLLFWIKDQKNIEGNELRQTSIPLSTVLDGSKAITFSGAAIPTNSTSSFSLALSFKVGELNRINRLLSLGTPGTRNYYLDESNQLHFDFQGADKLYAKVADWKLTEANKWYTMIISHATGQNVTGVMSIYIGAKGEKLHKVYSSPEGFLFNCKATSSIASSLKLGQTSLPSSGYLGSGQFANIRFWNRALTEAECEAVDTAQNDSKQGDAAPAGAPDGVTWDYFSMDGNEFYTRSSSAVPTTDKASMSGWVNSETRFEKKIGALTSSGGGMLTIDDYSNMFDGKYILNNGYDLTTSHCRENLRGVLVPFESKSAAGSQVDATVGIWLRVDAFPITDTDVLRRKLKTTKYSVQYKSVVFGYGEQTCVNTYDIQENDQDFAVQVTSDGCIKVVGSGLAETKFSKAKLSLRDWHCVQFVAVAKKSLCMYLDGEEVGNISSAMTLGYLPPVDMRPTSSTLLANNSSLTVGGWNGSVDSFAIFHSALTAQQVKAGSHTQL